MRGVPRNRIIQQRYESFWPRKGDGPSSSVSQRSRCWARLKILTASGFVGPVAAVDLSVAAQSDGDASLVIFALKLAGLARLNSCNAFNQTDDSQAKHFCPSSFSAGRPHSHHSKLSFEKMANFGADPRKEDGGDLLIKIQLAK